jgi:Zn-dependent peptidase ImmA (M78 family)
VPVDDVEEFYAKCQQIPATKGILAATSPFQEGTRAFARSKGISLLRYFDRGQFKWELKRSPSASLLTTSASDMHAIESGLSHASHVSTHFDIYAQTPARVTASVWELLADIVVNSGFTEQEMQVLGNPRKQVANVVPFIDRQEIEAKAESLLSRIRYAGGEVSLPALCDKERSGRRLKAVSFVAEATPPFSRLSLPLGRIIFDPNEIQIFLREPRHLSRERFTLAHELGHHFLGHGNYMKGELCDEADVALDGTASGKISDVRRMEWQANHLASALLMPRQPFGADAKNLIQRLDIPNKGFGALYVDNQPCNLQSYNAIMNMLTKKYGVSQAAATYRLQELGLLSDRRDSNPLRKL